MKFTEDHARIIEKNKHYYENLKRNGTITKMSSVTRDEFIKVYNEAISERRFNVGCAACLVELIELIYSNYEQYNRSERKPEQATRPEPRTHKPVIPEPSNKTTRVQNTRRTRRKD